MNKKKRSIVCLILTVIITAFVGFVEITGMPLWTPLEIVPMVNEIKLGLDLRGGMRVVYKADLDSLNADDKTKAESLDSAMEVLRTRLDSAGYNEATVTKQGSDQIVVEVPGVENPDELSDVLMKPAVLQFRGPDKTEVLLTGDDVERAAAGYDQQTSQYVVQLEFNSQGKDKFAEATKKYLNKIIYIYLDDTVISDPTVNAQITDGSAIISGKFTLEYAKNLAALIQSGALPVQLEEIAIKNVGATLGSGSLEKTIVAGAVAFGIILLFMAVIYGLSGLMADLALVVYMVLMVIALYIFDVTLTLPGIAGIILSLGMAVDANVVIFERIKEELAAGRSAANAVEKGFKNAFSAVIDANITTLIAVIVLAIFGTGTVQGFAITLGIGIVLSLLTEVVFVHSFLKWLVNMNVKNIVIRRKKKEEDLVNA